MMRWALILIGVTLWTMTSAGAAHACGCCDSKLIRKLVGWDETGQRVLVEMSDDGACEYKFALEVWDVGSPQPTSCFDLVYGPDQQITCDQLQDAGVQQGVAGKPRRSQVPGRFPRAVKQLPPKRIRVIETRVNEEEGDGVNIVVSVKINGKWRPVWDSAKAGVVPLFMRRGRPKVRIFPSPAGKAAVLALSGHDRENGNGRFPTELYWITLP
jgi:hypothetical protein